MKNKYCLFVPFLSVLCTLFMSCEKSYENENAKKEEVVSDDLLSNTFWVTEYEDRFSPDNKSMWFHKSGVVMQNGSFYVDHRYRIYGTEDKCVSTNFYVVKKWAKIEDLQDGRSMYMCYFETPFMFFNGQVLGTDCMYRPFCGESYLSEVFLEGNKCITDFFVLSGDTLLRVNDNKRGIILNAGIEDGVWDSVYVKKSYEHPLVFEQKDSCFFIHYSYRGSEYIYPKSEEHRAYFTIDRCHGDYKFRYIDQHDDYYDIKSGLSYVNQTSGDLGGADKYYVQEYWKKYVNETRIELWYDDVNYKVCFLNPDGDIPVKWNKYLQDCWVNYWSKECGCIEEYQDYFPSHSTNILHFKYELYPRPIHFYFKDKPKDKEYKIKVWYANGAYGESRVFIGSSAKSIYERFVDTLPPLEAIFEY